MMKRILIPRKGFMAETAVYRTIRYSKVSFIPNFVDDNPSDQTEKDHPHLCTFCKKPFMELGEKYVMVIYHYPTNIDTKWHLCLKCGEGFHPEEKGRRVEYYDEEAYEKAMQSLQNHDSGPNIQDETEEVGESTNGIEN